MKKFKRETVVHSPCTGIDRYLLTSYYPAWGRLVQTNFATESAALGCKGVYQTGLWRATPKINQTNR